MQIDDPGFQDFRDGRLLPDPPAVADRREVRRVQADPAARARHAAAARRSSEIADGEPGAGERLLPLENNGKAVDLDLVNNIMREPYADRFRLILNDLGAGLAARGKDLARGRSTAPTRRCARPTGCSRSSPSRTTSSPARRRTATRC